MRPLTRAEVREIDRLAIEEYGLPGIALMENAGANAARLLVERGIDGPVAIVCGRGNNGGDGFVIARHLDALGFVTRVLLACDPGDVRGDAATNLHVAERSGLPIVSLAAAEARAWSGELAGAAWIVDALLGTGASGPPRGAILTAIEAINAARSAASASGHTVRVFAVDLPSGLDCDTGSAPGACVRADVTATFVGPKRGFTDPVAAGFVGDVRVLPIGAPRAVLRRCGVTS